MAVHRAVDLASLADMAGSMPARSTSLKCAGEGNLGIPRTLRTYGLRVRVPLCAPRYRFAGVAKLGETHQLEGLAEVKLRGGSNPLARTKIWRIGGTGRRSRLKICRDLAARESSSLSSATNFAGAARLAGGRGLKIHWGASPLVSSTLTFRTKFGRLGEPAYPLPSEGRFSGFESPVGHQIHR
jgi:hypothetical protein